MTTSRNAVRGAAIAFGLFFILRFFLWATDGSFTSRIAFGLFCLPFTKIAQFIAYRTLLFNCIVYIEQGLGLMRFYTPVPRFMLYMISLLWAGYGATIGAVTSIAYQRKPSLALGAVGVFTVGLVGLALPQFSGIGSMIKVLRMPTSVSAHRMEERRDQFLIRHENTGAEIHLSPNDVTDLNTILSERVKYRPLLALTAPQSLCMFEPEASIDLSDGKKTMTVQIQAEHGAVKLQLDSTSVFFDCDLSEHEQLLALEKRIFSSQQ